MTEFGLIKRMWDIPKDRDMEPNGPPPGANHSEDYPTVQEMRIIGINIPFTDMVWLLVKFALALVPAIVVTTIIYYVFITSLGAMFLHK